MSEFINFLEPNKNANTPRHVIRIRGLPWSSCGADVLEVFPATIHICNGEAGVHFTLTKEGRSSGEAYVELESDEDVKRVLDMDKAVYIEKRYIEVFKATPDEMDYVLEKAERQANQPWDNVIRVRGLPFKCTSDNLRKFFKGMEMTPDGILILADGNGKNIGDGYIQFTSQEHAEQALLKHKETIDKRYIEVYKSSRNEMAEQTRKMKLLHSKRCPPLPQAPIPYPMHMAGVGPDGVYCHLVQMRGLPFKANEADIRKFFERFRVSAVQFEFGPDARPSGRATVAFATHGEAQEAMQLDKSQMGNRYIELFLKSNDCKPPRGIGTNGQYLFMLQMRGLPFKVTAKEIYKFFAPVPILDWQLCGVSGSAKLAFHSQEDLKAAFGRDKAYINERYIELFPYKPFQRPRNHHQHQNHPRGLAR